MFFKKLLGVYDPTDGRSEKGKKSLLRGGELSMKVEIDCQFLGTC